MTLKINVLDNSCLKGFIWRYEIWKDYKNYYFQKNDPYMIVGSEDGLPCYNFLEIDAINQSTEPVVVIDCMTEGPNAISLFNLYRTDRYYIMFVNGHWELKDHPLKINCTIIPSLFWLMDDSFNYGHPFKFPFYVDKNYKFEYPKPMNFVSTIGHVRIERDYLVNLLTNRLTHKNNIIKYSGQDHGEPSTKFDMFTVKPGEFDPGIQLNEKYNHSISRSLPINMYNQAYFMLVVETLMNSHSQFFITEKTIKALITGIPFVMGNVPYCLKNLKKLGFETFSELWDESYDEELDFEKRMNKIVDLCNTLADFDWEKNKAKLEHIKVKNRINFLNLHKVADDEFTNAENIIKALPL